MKNQRFSSLLLLGFLCSCANRVAALVDLSSPSYEYSESPHDNDTITALLELASSRKDINAMLALEHGKIVAEYYDKEFESTHNFALWSGTKSWTSLLFGILEQQGFLDVGETLWNIWPDPNIWESIEDKEERSNIIIESMLQMRAGLKMPK